MIDPKYAFFHNVVVLGQNLQNMCYIITEGHQNLQLESLTEKGPFLTIGSPYKGPHGTIPVTLSRHV